MSKSLLALTYLVAMTKFLVRATEQTPAGRLCLQFTRTADLLFAKMESSRVCLNIKNKIKILCLWFKVIEFSVCGLK